MKPPGRKSPKNGEKNYKLGGRFGPEKKDLAPHPPQFPNSAQTPSRPLCPSPSLLETPPPLLLSNKNRPPPSRRLRLPLPPPRAKKIKNIETSTNYYSPRSDPRKWRKITEKLQKLYFRSNFTPFLGAIFSIFGGRTGEGNNYYSSRALLGQFSPFSGVGPGREL